MTRIVPRALVLIATFALPGFAVASQNVPLPLPAGCVAAAQESGDVAPLVPTQSTFPPAQLEIRTPFGPSSFGAGGFTYLLYELQLLNLSESAIAVDRIDVLAPGAEGEDLLLSVAGQRLEGQLSFAGGGTLDVAGGLAAGHAATAYLCLVFDSEARLPTQLRHRVVSTDLVAEGPLVGTRHSAVKILESPVRGGHWVADNALALDRHHRPGLFVAGGLAQISRRYAIDWKRRVDGDFQSGDPLDVRSYHAYGQPVYAVADAVVVEAKDGLPDNVPRTAAGFTPALALDMKTLAGNTVVLDLGDDQFAHYAHLQPGSVAVRAGQRVRRGDALARIGNSGDARWPHLHFQVSTGADILASEGVPFVIRRFRARDAEGGWTHRSHEFPLGGDEVAF